MTAVLPKRPPHTPLGLSATPATVAFRQALPWLLVSLAMTMASLVGQVPPWSLLAFGVCTLWRYVIARRGWPLPSMAVRVLIFLPVAAGVVKTYGTNPTAQGLLTFLIALMSLKILELRSPRDFTIVSLLGYFMALSGFFYDQSLGLGLYLCLALLVNTVALIRCHSGGRREVWPAVKLALGLSAQALPLVILLFVIFPRLQGSFLRRLGGATTGLTGMSEHLQPGSFSSLVQSDDPAFRAKIGDGVAVPTYELYWRGLVLEVCEESMSWRAGLPTQASNDGSVLPAASNARRLEQRITLIPQGERWMFALDRPVGIRLPSSLPTQLSDANVLQSRDTILNNVVYTAVSELSPADGKIPPEHRGLYNYLPHDVSERAKVLARGWHPAGSSDESVIRAGEDFFRTGGFTYTLNPGLLPKKDALDTFLFKTRQGFCEHYAAAFSTLMRAAGLPSRIVVGYQGGEYNRSWGGHYTIRQSDAHAWSEVWVTTGPNGYGHWQRVDPTAVVAPDRLSLGAENYAALAADGSLSEEARLARLNELNSPGSWRWLTHHALLAWDGLDEQWNQVVLGYDTERQQHTFRGLGVANIGWLGGCVMALAAVFSIVGAGTAAMRAFNRGPARPDDPARRLYGRFCRRLAAAANVHRDPAEGPLDYARRAASVLPEQASAIRRITDLYVATRYAPAAGGGSDASPSPFQAFREAVKQFRPVRRAV